MQNLLQFMPFCCYICYSRNFMWGKIEPKSTFVEKKWQISGLFRTMNHMQLFKICHYNWKIGGGCGGRVVIYWPKVNILALINPSSCSMFILPIITENKFLLGAQNMVPILCTEHLLYYITWSSKDECRTDVLSSIIYLKSTDHLDQ